MKILNKTLPVILAIGIFTTGPAAAYSISDVDVPFIDSSVTLKVDGEVATLHGNVDSPSDIANVERAVTNLDGIQEVQNNLTVRPK